MILFIDAIKQSKQNDTYHIIQRKHVTHGSRWDNDKDITSHRIKILGKTEFIMYQLRFRIILFFLMFPAGLQSLFFKPLSFNTIVIPNRYNITKYQVILFIE